MIAIRDLCLTQGKFSLSGVSLAIPTGKYGVLMGRTGSGKSSILEAIAGLRPITKGVIELDQRDVTHLPPGSRCIGYVPQDAALFGSMTVREHLSFALDLRRAPADYIQQRVSEMATWLGLTHLLDRRPFGLSGGEAQRVALGRALAFQPRLLLLDEPLSSLDEETREHLMTHLEQIRRGGLVTVLHITHNPHEAERLGDVVLRLQNGQVT